MDAASGLRRPAAIASDVAAAGTTFPASIALGATFALAASALATFAGFAPLDQLRKHGHQFLLNLAGRFVRVG